MIYIVSRPYYAEFMPECATLEHKVGTLEHQFAKLEHKCGTLEHKLATLEHQCGTLEHQFAKLGHKLATLEHQFDRCPPFIPQKEENMISFDT